MQWSCGPRRSCKKTYLQDREAALLEVSRQLDEQYQYAWDRGHFDLARSYTVATTYILGLIMEVQRALSELTEKEEK